MMTSLLSSQTFSQQDETVCVPKQAVKNALIMSVEFQQVKAELDIKDGIITDMTTKSDLQLKQIENLNKVVSNKDGVIQEKDNTIKLKEEQIEVIKKEKKGNLFKGIFTGAAGGASLILILVLL